MSMPKYLILTFAEVDEDEFITYLEHLKEDHNIKITIEETGNQILYTGEDPTGNENLYAIENGGL